MDKLTQFVTRSFENESDQVSAEQCSTVNFDKTVAKMSDEEFNKNQEIEKGIDAELPLPKKRKVTPVAKNWLISDISSDDKEDEVVVNCSSQNISTSSANFPFKENKESRRNSLTENEATNLTIIDNSERSGVWFLNDDIKNLKSNQTSFSSSPIDLEESKSSPENFRIERVEDQQESSSRPPVLENPSSKRLCKFST
ncbi:uncharacterized protein LOC112905621 [Agrilus planipennis]|uniref:Uncharacterized protein LOC112905621 n=1 Tax=Agrilus planipennis TaxID=224129 RepID=A0A7F5RDX2_AGRPL|nr:uncharacterized protein LOC112905621 [Agrilus planipennis]